jgi:hypothetical protein
MSRRSIPQSPQNPSTPDGPQNEPSYDEELAAQFSPAFAVIPGRALTDTRLSPSEFRVFAVMCGHANRADRICWPKQETLAKLLGTDKFEISRAVRRLAELGYVQIIKRGYPLSNKYRIVFEDPSPSATQSCVPAQLRVASQRNPELRPSATKNRNIEQEHRTPYSESSYLSNSLAQSAEKRDVVSPVTVLAPAAREREIDAPALKRDPLYGAFTQALGYAPETPALWQEWISGINQLHRLGATEAQIVTAIANYANHFPNAKSCTVRAIVKWWPMLKEGKSADVIKLENARRSEEIRQAAQRAADAETQRRRAEQQHEVDRLIRDIVDEVGSGEPPHRG